MSVQFIIEGKQKFCEFEHVLQSVGWLIEFCINGNIYLSDCVKCLCLWEDETWSWCWCKEDEVGDSAAAAADKEQAEVIRQRLSEQSCIDTGWSATEYLS